MSFCARNGHTVLSALVLGLFSLAINRPVQAAPPVADVSQSQNTSGIVPLDVILDGALSQCNSTYPCSYHWDFGDGTASNPIDDAVPITRYVHTYTAVGTFTATLTVTVNVPVGIKPKASATVTVTTQQGETLTSYVNTCKQALVFNDADIPNNLNCAKSSLFAPNALGPKINDYMGYARVNDDVDLTFACRWLQNGTGVNEFTDPPFIIAQSIEMIIHNRRNGNTCFFKSKPGSVPAPDGTTRTGVSPVAIVSPTVAAKAAPNTPEANFWEPPIQIDRIVVCADCHIAGPYIATPRIAPFLAQFGLLNNGHDTFGLSRDPQNNNNIVGNYHIVGSTFSHFKSVVADGNVMGTCANSCHSIGYNGRFTDFFIGVNTLLPGITHVIDVYGTQLPDISVNTSGVMPADGPSTGTADTNSYSWINRDNPGADATEIETFTASKNNFQVLDYCGVPTTLVAHAVGSTASFSTTDLAKLPDKLRTFNTREGLVCMNADQPNGKQCNNYSVKYQCSDGSWAGPYDTDLPAGDGDHEERSRHGNVCTASGLTAIAIQATTTVNGAPLIVNGPNDRLAQFSPTGLVCRNSEQPNGASCSSYVVQYRNCTAPWQSYLAKLKSVWVNPPTFNDRYLTTTNNVSGAETRAQANNYQYPSQDWIIEIVSGSTVRLKDVWSGKYLTASSVNEQATVIVQDSDTSQARQRWVIESVSGSNTEKRLRNVGSNRYLTVGNYTSDPYFAPMYSQSLSNQNWASQRWVIQ